MPYRFSATTGNIVRPIEASCLNTTTGALITPLKYGPAGSAITMWNGVIESYSLNVFAKPSARAGSATGYASAYDGAGTPGTTTTYASLQSGFANSVTVYETYSFSGSTTYTKYKLYLTYDWSATIQEDQETFEPVQAALTIQYSINGTVWTSVFITNVSSNNGSRTYTTPFDLGTLPSTSLDNFKVRFTAKSNPYKNALLKTMYASGSFYIKDVYIEAEN